MRARRHVRLETLSSRAEIERVCIRNLLTSDKERVFFKDLESRFILVSAGWLEGEGRDSRCRR